MDRMHVICLLKKTGHLKCCSSNYTCKTALATLISLNLKPLKPAIAIQLPKSMGTFFPTIFTGTSHIYTKILPKPQNPTRQNVNPKTTSWIPPTSRWFAEPQTPSAGSAVRSPLLGWLPLTREVFLREKKRKAPGTPNSQPVFLWLEINWMLIPNLYIEKWLDVSPNIHLKENGCLGYQAGHL